MRKTTFAMLALAAGILAGCVSSVIRDPNHFWFTSRDGLNLGNYNSSAISQDKVKSVISSTCVGGIADYKEQLDPEGMMLFAASCANGGVNQAGTYYADRQSDGSFKVTFGPR